MAASPGSQADQEEVRVYDTDYASFALLLSRRNSGSQSILRVSLLCECTPPGGGRAQVGGGAGRRASGAPVARHPPQPAAEGPAVSLGLQAERGP